MRNNEQLRKSTNMKLIVLEHFPDFFCGNQKSACKLFCQPYVTTTALGNVRTNPGILPQCSLTFPGKCLGNFPDVSWKIPRHVLAIPWTFPGKCPGIPWKCLENLPEILNLLANFFANHTSHQQFVAPSCVYPHGKMLSVDQAVSIECGHT